MERVSAAFSCDELRIDFRMGFDRTSSEFKDKKTRKCANRSSFVNRTNQRFDVIVVERTIEATLRYLIVSPNSRGRGDNSKRMIDR